VISEEFIQLELKSKAPRHLEMICASKTHKHHGIFAIWSSWNGIKVAFFPEIMDFQLSLGKIKLVTVLDDFFMTS